MSEKHKHFVSVIAPNGEFVTVDIYLTVEQYELINRISALITSEADITAPILVISGATVANEHYEDGIVEEE